MSQRSPAIGFVRFRADGLGRRVSLPPAKPDGDGAESYTQMLWMALGKKGGVPSRLTKTDRRKAGKEGTPWWMFAGSPSGRTTRLRSRSTSLRGRALVGVDRGLPAGAGGLPAGAGATARRGRRRPVALDDQSAVLAVGGRAHAVPSAGAALLPVRVLVRAMTQFSSLPTTRIPQAGSSVRTIASVCWS